MGEDLIHHINLIKMNKIALSYEIKNQQAIILVKGSYDNLITVAYEMIVSSNGKIEIAYKRGNLPN